jgi:hypothetical protein
MCFVRCPSSPRYGRRTAEAQNTIQLWSVKHRNLWPYKSSRQKRYVLAILVAHGHTSPFTAIPSGSQRCWKYVVSSSGPGTAMPHFSWMTCGKYANSSRWNTLSASHCFCGCCGLRAFLQGTFYAGERDEDSAPNSCPSDLLWLYPPRTCGGSRNITVMITRKSGGAQSTTSSGSGILSPFIV